jgi:hypothetical protein
MKSNLVHYIKYHIVGAANRSPPSLRYHELIYWSNYSAIFTNLDGVDRLLNQGWPIINESEQRRKFTACFVKYSFFIFWEI